MLNETIKNNTEPNKAGELAAAAIDSANSLTMEDAQRLLNSCYDSSSEAGQATAETLAIIRRAYLYGVCTGLKCQ